MILEHLYTYSPWCAELLVTAERLHYLFIPLVIHCHATPQKTQNIYELSS